MLVPATTRGGGGARTLTRMTGATRSTTRNFFEFVVEGEMIEIFWIHAKMYFPCKVISWTPLRATRRSTTLNSRSSLWRPPAVVVNKSPNSTASATKKATRRRQLSQGEGDTKETLAGNPKKAHEEE